MSSSVTYAQYTGPKLGVIDRWLVSLIRDERDLPFLHLALFQSLTVIPFAVYLYWSFSWWLAPIYWAVALGWLMPPFILMLHNVCHRKLFKREYAFMNHYIPWVLGPFFGETPETYYAHHIGMHHVENNLEKDLSSTMKYTRDRPTHFLHYFATFFFTTLVNLTKYHKRKNRKKTVRRLLMGELGFAVVTVALMFVSWQATLTVLVVPFLVCRFGMMAGNWGQHAFIDASDPGNSYRNSITCIDVPYNKRCFNDGYHIGHHVKADRHWTEMPADYEKSKARYAEEGSIVFRGVDFFGVWFFLMLGRYDQLAKRYVELDGKGRSQAEIEALLRERTRPIVRETVAA